MKSTRPRDQLHQRRAAVAEYLPTHPAQPPPLPRQRPAAEAEKSPKPRSRPRLHTYLEDKT
ncbi:MAG: hypothetical protein AABM66_15175 [Actinomycetota bacterium]